MGEGVAGRGMWGDEKAQGEAVRALWSPRGKNTSQERYL